MMILFLFKNQSVFAAPDTHMQQGNELLLLFGMA